MFLMVKISKEKRIKKTIPSFRIELSIKRKQDGRNDEKVIYNSNARTNIYWYDDAFFLFKYYP